MPLKPIRPSRSRRSGAHRRGARTRGFTLIELMAVITLIGILAVIAYPYFAQSPDRAYLATVVSDFRNFAGAQEGHRHARMTYALDTVELGFEGRGGPD